MRWVHARERWTDLASAVFGGSKQRLPGVLQALQGNRLQVSDLFLAHTVRSLEKAFQQRPGRLRRLFWDHVPPAIVALLDRLKSDVAQLRYLEASLAAVPGLDAVLQALAASVDALRNQGPHGSAIDSLAGRIMLARAEVQPQGSELQKHLGLELQLNGFVTGHDLARLIQSAIARTRERVSALRAEVEDARAACAARQELLDAIAADPEAQEILARDPWAKAVHDHAATLLALGAFGGAREAWADLKREVLGQAEESRASRARLGGYASELRALTSSSMRRPIRDQGTVLLAEVDEVRTAPVLIATSVGRVDRKMAALRRTVSTADAMEACWIGLRSDSDWARNRFVVSGKKIQQMPARSLPTAKDWALMSRHWVMIHEGIASAGPGWYEEPKTALIDPDAA